RRQPSATVIGGSEVFAAAMPLAARLEITHVHSDTQGDVSFPRIDPAVWREASRTEHPAGPHDEAAFDVTVYVRR
ncbi:MAG: dihydrofolate reductase, partial [Pseudolabrys sp.]